MKSIVRLLILVLAMLIGDCAEARQTASSNVTQILTVTNVGSNGYSIQINGGPLRTFTNVIVSAVTNIQQTNSILQTATNLFLALSVYPNSFPYVAAVMTNSNTIVLTTINGQNLTVITNNTGGSGWSNWVSIKGATNFLTNATGVRVPTNAVGITEQSNVAYGIFGYLNSPFLTNGSIASSAVNSSLAQWSNFVNAAALAALSNSVLRAGTNTTNYASNLYVLGTNYTWIQSTNSTNYASNIVSILGLASTNFTLFASNYLYGLLLLQPTPWQDAGHDVYLTNGGSQLRLYASSNGIFQAYDSGGNIFLYNDGTGSSLGDTLLVENGVNGVELDKPGQSGGTTTGGAILRSQTGQTGLQISGLNSGVQTWSPITFFTSTWPATSTGSVTNFYDGEGNSSSSPTAADSITVPANALTNSGDSIVREGTVYCSTGGSAYQIQLEFPGNGGTLTVFDSGSVVAPSGSYCYFKATITRSGATSFRWNSTFSWIGNTNVSKGGVVSTFNSGSGWAAGSTYNLELTASATGYLTVLTDNIEFRPSSVWQSLLP